MVFQPLQIVRILTLKSTLNDNRGAISNRKDRQNQELRMLNASNTVISGRLNVVRGLKQTNQIVSFKRTRHMIGL